MKQSLQEMVDLKHGTISRRLFSDQDLYQLEQERIFARTWLFVGHESLIPNPGDFFTSYMGEESVIVTRDKAGTVHVMLNSCRHRGTRVCRYDQGNTAAFYCPYHGWSYDTAGKLIGVPHYQEGYEGQLDRSRWGLIEVAQLANYQGSIWATWDASAPSFLDYLGGMKFYLDLALDSSDGAESGSEVIGGIQKWASRATGSSAPRISASTTITTPAIARSTSRRSVRAARGGAIPRGCTSSTLRFRGLATAPAPGSATAT